MKHLCRIFALLLTLANLTAQDTRPSVAVLDFEAKGIAVYEAETLTERLRSEISNTNAVRLTDRKLLEKILEEQGLQQSGCTTDECAAEVGQLLGAQFIISGSIGKLGNTYTIDAKMVSVTTGAAERAKTVSYKGEISGLIVEMEILAWEIVGLKAPQRLLIKRGGASMDDKMTVAILDFEPRGISNLEAQTLTDRFATEINNTGKAVLVDRNSMREVMQEQGYTEVECSSEECAAEVGAMLGVQFMISGAIGKLGDTYTIDAKMFEVATGAAAKTKNTTYTGKVDGLITEIEVLAWEMMGLDPPKDLLKRRGGGSPVTATPVFKGKTRFGAMLRSAVMPGWGQLYSGNKLMGWSFLGGEVVLGALVFSAYSAYATANSDLTAFNQQYNSSTDPAQIQDLRSKILQADADQIKSNDQMTTMIYAAGGLWAANVIHAFLTGPKADSASRSSGFDLVYHPEILQPQLRFSIALD
ncbi:MAG: CsgG/HfaB family protein [Candidatus Marinimicrobia bacterium]|nr:CsgG/HfaB family protein [Candidatus Neomarinimicrobiota bacterium]